jgi:hypothetical protein
MTWYSTASKRNKLLCRFRKPDLTLIEKFVPKHSRYVIFDGGKYIIEPKRVILQWYNRGIHQFFPMWIPSLDYKWDTDVALDPRKFTNTWDTPEARNAASSEDDWKGFNKGMQAQTGKKVTMFQQYLPWITIGAIVILGVMVYTQGQRVDIMEEMIKVLPR